MISASLISKYRQALATLGDSVQVTLANTYADAVARGLVESEIRDLLAEAAWSATSNLGNLASLTAADFLIIPVQAQFLAMRGMAKIMNVISIVQERLNSNLKIGGIVITQYDKRKTLNKSVTEIIHDSFCDKVFKTIIRDNVALAEAPINGKNIYEYNKNSNGAKDYMALAGEVIKLK